MDFDDDFQYSTVPSDPQPHDYDHGLKAPPCFTRKAMIVIKSTYFTKGDYPTEPQPATSSITLRYFGVNGWTSVTLGMSFNPAVGSAQPFWSVSWDTSVVMSQMSHCHPNNRVEWVVYSAGNSVQAANEGCFYVEANHANTV